MSRSILVSVEQDGRMNRVGTAFVSRRRGISVTTFRYDRSWIADPEGYAVEPAFPLDSGSHHAKDLPGALSDCAPDRWGRYLITKRFRAEALANDRPAPQLSVADFLLGVTDATRQGALRFQLEQDGPYLEVDGAEVPQLIELPRLLRAADAVVEGSDDMAAIKTLLDAGTGSLGGARPKASVRDGERQMIAKFPHQGDEWDVMGWEKTVLDLADLAGIDVPSSRLTRVDGRGVLLLDRFDREPGGRRVGYVSAMSLLEASDNEPRDYVEVAETLAEHGARVRADLAQLWRRLVFNVAVHNTDDHLRNHGFLRRDRGWVLAPMFDVNPNPDVSASRTTSIAGAYVRADEVAGLRASMDDFGLDEETAATIVNDVLEAIGQWSQTARVNGIPDRDLRRFAPVFDGVRDPLATLAEISDVPSRPARVPKGEQGAGRFSRS